LAIKLPSIARGLINKGIDFFWERRLSRGYDPQRTIVVSGTPRGGTTWIAETLAKAPGTLHLWEPLHPRHVAETLAKAPGTLHLWEPLYPLPSSTLAASRSGTELYVTPTCVLYQHIKRIITGDVRLSDYLMKNGFRYFASKSFRNMLFFQRFVVKLVRGNLLLYWMLKEFGLKGALIIRHPCAVVASQMHHSDWGDARALEDIRNHRLPIYEKFDPSFAKVARSVNTTEELLALEWCIRTLVPLRQPKPHPWLLTVYEDLIEDMGEWDRLCSYLSCPTPSKDLVTRLSATSLRRDNELSPSASIDKWRRYLSEKQIEDILRVCSEMGVDFYDKTPYPKNLDKYKQLGISPMTTGQAEEARVGKAEGSMA
jgi:hypothetical protein